MSKAFLNGEGHDEVWIIETDKMKNYKSYFEVDNSCSLIEKFCVIKRGIALKGRESIDVLPDAARSKNIIESWRKIRS
jgi:hypothetical protein